MPGRAYIGLDPNEKNPSKFQTSRLPDAPEITPWLVTGAVVVALVVVFVGYSIHLPSTYSTKPVIGGIGAQRANQKGQDITLVCWDGSLPDHVGCPPVPVRWGMNIPMVVWFAVAALAATLVITTPFLVYEIKRRTGRI
jgi:hypothetical protein